MQNKLLILLFAFLLLFVSCEQAINISKYNDGASISLQLGSPARTVFPVVAPVKFEVELSGVGTPQTQNSTGGTVSFTNLSKGTYDITVKGFDSADKLIAMATESGIALDVGESKNIKIRLLPVRTGSGELSFVIDWSESGVTTVSSAAVSVFDLVNGTAYTGGSLDSSQIAGGILTYSASGMDTSDYLVSITLKDGTDAEMVTISEVFKVYGNLSSDGFITLNADDLTDAPKAPENVMVAYTSLGFHISWNDMSHNEDAFIIEVNINDGGWNVLAGAGNLAAGTTSFTDATTSVTAPVKYRVIAKNASGQSISAVSSPARLKVATITDTSIKLKWNDVPGDSGDPSTANFTYQVYSKLGVHTDASDLSTWTGGTVVSGGSVLEDLFTNLLSDSMYSFVLKITYPGGETVVSQIIQVKCKAPVFDPEGVRPADGYIEVDLEERIIIPLTSGSTQTDFDALYSVTLNGDVLSMSYDPVLNVLYYEPGVSGNPLLDEGLLYTLLISAKESGNATEFSYQFITLDYQYFEAHWKLDGNGDDSRPLSYGAKRPITGLDTDWFRPDEKVKGSASLYLDNTNKSWGVIENDDGIPQFGKIENMDFGSQFTVTIWVKMPTVLNPRLNTILANVDSPEKKDGFKLCINTWGEEATPSSDRHIVLEVGSGDNGGKILTAGAEGPVLSDEWYHLAYVVDKSAKVVKFYFNGEEQTLDYRNEDTVDPNHTPDRDAFDLVCWDAVGGDANGFETKGPFYFGAFEGATSSSGAFGFQGHLDDMRAYNKVLTDAQIKQISQQK